MSLSPRQLAEGLILILRCRAASRRFRRHHRARVHHLTRAAEHTDAMAAELNHHASLCARWGGRSGPPAPRTGSSVPAVPLPSRLAADSLGSARMVVPDHEGVSSCPEDGERAVTIAAKGGPHPI
ncbi:hypothetical protein [Methylobacterium sp. Leaf456]|uniref:hypothetical protein n=1 Tax=Methylobacterium sp. Leaf456 TaxID=1736382 RepID=UPI0012E37B54|nr:hypothetical protein [Methylobacterium sp. Leaf456]